MGIKTVLAVAAATAVTATASFGATLAVMNGDHDVIGGTNAGHLGLDGLGHTSTLHADSAAGYAAALASGADAIVVEQSAGDAADIAGLNAYMSAGGTVIVLGGNDSLTNSLFGSGATFEFAGVDGSTFGKTAAAVGTTFADDAATLVGLSSHHETLAGFPAGATNYYGGAGSEIVFGKAVGAGELFYIGWDYCCGGTDAQANDWYGVIDSAIEFNGASVVPLPAAGWMLIAGLGGLFSMRRKTKA